MIEISKTFTISCAHILPQHPGKCSRLHGHNYTIEVAVEGEVGGDGMVMDFDALNDLVKTLIVDRFDHKFILPTGNAFVRRDSVYWYVNVPKQGEVRIPVNMCAPIVIKESTAELLTLEFHKILSAHAALTYLGLRVRVWETEKCYAEIC